MVTLIESTLPWNGTAVRKVDDGRGKMSCRLSPDESKFLPARMEVYVDQSIDSQRVERFLETTASFLVQEMAIRDARVWRLKRSGLCEDAEVDAMLTVDSHQQTWALYFSENGGIPEADTIVTAESEQGVIPCSTMRNHGVGWRRRGQKIDLWLVTAPKPGQDWNMDSDIGHESAHAAFAPVPLFVQSAAQAHFPASLIDADHAQDLNPEQVARFLYFCSELAVVGIRGESRKTHTRLPIDDPEELFSFLRLGDELFPGCGFEYAQSVCKRVRGNFDLEQSDAVFALTAPILRVLPHLNAFVDVVTPPSVPVLRAVAPLGSQLVKV